MNTQRAQMTKIADANPNTIRSLSEVAEDRHYLELYAVPVLQHRCAIHLIVDLDVSYARL
jgi:hypothetical protein